MAGFALVEAVVGMLIFTIGVLGLVALLGTMTRAQSASTFRAEAVALSGELIGNMWADSVANRISYASSGTACTYTPCARWIQKVVTTLPKGSATVLIDAATGVTTISISWTVPTHGAHSYVTSTSIF
jgi:type IV pilus assembly protein PilV